jgi:hypothetical protein
MRAAHALYLERAQAGTGATLRELVQRSQVGYKVARALVPKLKERGNLEIVGERRVKYRNRPVAEYMPTGAMQPAPVASGPGWVDLGNCVQSWAR